MTCTSCGYSGPVSPEAAQRLHAASALVRGLSTRERQLSGLQRKAIKSSGCLTALLIGVLVVLAIPALGFAVCGVALVSTEEGAATTSFGASFLVTVFTPLVVLLVFGIGGMTWLRRSRKALRLAAAAEPPSQQGGAARCRLCGADLPSSNDPVVRCAFCESDNLVDPQLLGQIATSQHAALNDYQQVVGTKTTAVSKALKNATFAIVMAVIVGPFSVVALFLTMGFVLSSIESPPDLDDQYGLIPTPGHTFCAASVYQHSEGDWIVNFWDYPPEGMEAFTRRPTLDGLQIVDANHFRGRRVSGRTKDGEVVTGTVERVHSTHLGVRNYAVVQGESVDIASLCLLDVHGR